MHGLGQVMCSSLMVMAGRKHSGSSLDGNLQPSITAIQMGARESTEHQIHHPHAGCMGCSQPRAEAAWLCWLQRCSVPSELPLSSSGCSEISLKSKLLCPEPLLSCRSGCAWNQHK